MKLKKVIVILLILPLIFFLTGCENKNENNDLKTKTDSSIEYLDNTLISLINQLNNISFENFYVSTEKVKLDSESKGGSGSSVTSSSSDESKGDGEEGTSSSSDEGKSNKSGSTTSSINASTMKPNGILLSDRNNIDWEGIKAKTENLYASWSSIIIDLYKLGISNDNILKFSELLDNSLTNVKNENKEGTVQSYAQLYNLLPVFLDSYSDDRTKLNLQWTKAHIINAYTAVGINNWNIVTSETNQALQNYSAVMSDAKFVNEKAYNTNKTFVSLEELQNSIKTQDSDIFYIKYKNFIQEVNLL